MRRIRGKDTQPEMRVRRITHALGYRFRLHRRDLPGTPDLVFPGKKKVIFVHGCFWHRHTGCKLAASPKTRVDFWEQKFEDNIRRDSEATEQLRADGWSVLTIWECETGDPSLVEKKLIEFLGQ